MATPLQHFWTYMNLLGWKDRYFEVLKPYGVTSFKYLSMQRQEELVDYVSREWRSRSKRPRGAVIHYLCIMPGYDFKTVTGDPNYDKIDEFVMGMGSNNPNKKPLNRLTLAELNKVVTQVKAMYNHQLKITK